MLVIGMVIVGRCAKSQTIPAMVEQLAELKLLEHTTGRGYQIMTTGVNSIGSSVGAEYQLHQTYFHSLDIINPQIYPNDQISLTTRVPERLGAAYTGAVDRRSAAGAGVGQRKTYIPKKHASGNVSGLYDAGTRLY